MITYLGGSLFGLCSLFEEIFKSLNYTYLFNKYNYILGMYVGSNIILMYHIIILT
jgi:hypothetical protein